MKNYFGKKMTAITLGFCLFCALSGCQTSPSQNAPSAPLETNAPSMETVSPPPVISPDMEPTASAWHVDEDMLTDEYLISLVIDMEVGLVGDNSFTFSTPTELSESELYLCFLLLSDHDELVERYWDEENEVFTFSSDVITAQLSKYFKDFYFDITQNHNYDAQADAIVTPLASGFGGDRYMKIMDKSLDGNTVSFTVNFYDDYEMRSDPYEAKTYTIEFYDGGYYYLSSNLLEIK